MKIFILDGMIHKMKNIPKLKQQLHFFINLKIPQKQKL